MANHHKRSNNINHMSQSQAFNSQASNSLNANAQAFIPSPISSKSPSNASSCSTESPCFAKAKLETIPESPSITPLLTHIKPKSSAPLSTLSTSASNNASFQPQSHTQFPFNPLSLPQFYANQMNDTLALIPAMDQNGLLVMIPPSLATPGSLFTPIINVGQPLLAPVADANDEDTIYKYMDIDRNHHDETYQNIEDIKREIQDKYRNDTIQSLPKPANNKYSNTFLLRTGQVLHKTSLDSQTKEDNDAAAVEDSHKNEDILQNIPEDLQFLLSPNNKEEVAELSLNPYFVSPHQPIADMQSLLFMNNYTAITPQLFPMQMNNIAHTYTHTSPQIQTPSNARASSPKRRKKYNGSSYKLPPRFQNRESEKENVKEGHIESETQQVLGQKVVYLVEDGNKHNGGFAQYSITPDSSRQSTPKPHVDNRYKQSLTGMKFEGRRNKEVHECFKDNPDLFAKDGYQSVMKKITYQIPKEGAQETQIHETQQEKEKKSIQKVLSGILNKLTPEKFNHLVNATMDMIESTHSAYNKHHLAMIASIFHSVIIREKPLVRLYGKFLIEISQRIASHNCNHHRKKKKKRVCLLDLVLDLIWKQIDDQYKKHDAFCEERDSDLDIVTLNELKEEYNKWLHRLYGNYVLLVEIYCRRAVAVSYDKIHAIIQELIAMNTEWSWNIIYVILIFHGVALQKLEAKSLEEYLESIDDLVDGINYSDRRQIANENAINNKYKHIPLRIKYLLMDVQEHIESTNAKNLVIEHRGIMNPKKINEIHAEFCRENNMTQHQLRKLLSLSTIESHHHHHTYQQHHHHHNNNNNTHHHHHINNNISRSPHNNAPYLQRRFAPQQNEYPWHTPPRFQRMRQQQRLQNKQKKKKSQQQQQIPQIHHRHQHHNRQTNNNTQCVKGPLYLRNASVPAPPNKCPPAPPGPAGPFCSAEKSNDIQAAATVVSVSAAAAAAVVPQTIIKVVSNKHNHRKKKKHIKEVHNNNNNNNNGWSTVKRSNNKTKKTTNIVIKKHNNNNNNHRLVEKEHKPHKLAKKVKEKVVVMKEETEEEEEEDIDTEEEDDDRKIELEEKKVATTTTNVAKEVAKSRDQKNKVKNKKKRKKKNKRQQQKKKQKQQQQTNKKSKRKKECFLDKKSKILDDCEDEEEDDCDDEHLDEDDYDSSDDEIWCETTESYEEDDVVPAFLFGAENETERIEELETALFCEYIDDDEDEDEDDDDDIENSEIVDIINRYLETGNEDEACLYFRNGENEEQDKDIFVANCIKLYVINGILDNVKSQYDLREIERLFVRQMYFNSILHKRNYIHSLKLLSQYFESIMVEKPESLQPLCKILVVLIENKILRITDIANTLYLDAKCSNAMQILSELIKHLMHYQMNHLLKLRTLIREVKQIKFIPSHLIQKISIELNIKL